MDVSSALDPLNDTPTLPELSFDDLLDVSPVKKSHSTLNDPLTSKEQASIREDDTLNTPGPKKPPPSQSTVTAMNAAKTTPTPTLKQSAVAGAPAVSVTPSSSNVKTAQAPIVLNTKNILPKGIPVISSNQLIKITPKVVAASSPSTSASITAAAAGKAAVKTANGQIIYLQKSAGLPAVRLQAAAVTTPSTVSTGAITSATTTAVTVASPTSTTSANKTVSIQVLRTADGSIVPLKASPSVGTKGVHTLSPTVAQQLTGKKIITTSSGQVLIKAPLKSTALPSVAAGDASKTIKIQKISTSAMTCTTAPTTPTTLTPAVIAAANTIVTSTSTSTSISTGTSINTSTTTSTSTTATTRATVLSTQTTAMTTSSAKTVVAGVGVNSSGVTIPAAGKIVVQSANGKQIVVSNQNLIKLSPKPGAGGAASTTTTGAVGQLHAIQVHGKPGVQYVRVLSNTKITTTTSGTTIKTSPKVEAGSTSIKPPTSPAAIKILNSIPQKFTVMRTANGGPTKFLLTSPKKEDGKGTKTIVAVPALRSLGGVSDAKKTVSLISSTALSGKSAAQMAGSSATLGSLSALRKHKISEINSEIKRITASSAAGGSDGELKRAIVTTSSGGSRVVVVPRSMLRPGLARSGIVQRIAVQANSTHSNSGGGGNSANNNSIGGANNNNNGNLLGSHFPRKLYSVLKHPRVDTMDGSGGGAAGNAGGIAYTKAELKSLVICGKAQELLAQQQQHKAMQLKRQLQQRKEKELLEKEREEREHEEQKQREHKELLMQKELAKKQQLNPLSNNKFLRIKQEPVDLELKQMEEVGGGVRRKHCNCSKSQCLKLYCDCFANGEFCQDCTCKHCFNNLQNEDERQRAIRSCLERNPSAFKPKITTSREQADMRLHNKGCNCKRSGCLKNYCECYEAKIPCSSNCKCVGCRNIEDRPDLDMDPIDPKILASIGNPNTVGAGQKRSNADRLNFAKAKLTKDGELANRDHATANSGNSNHGSSNAEDIPESSGGAENKACSNFITQEVVDATIQCMISQADDCDKNSLGLYQTERLVMEELGRCLVEIIDFSIRNTDVSFTQD